MKKFGKRVLAVGLSLCMAIAAAGCGGSGDDKGGEGGVISKEEKAKLATEGVFKEQSFNAPWESMNIATAVKTGDSFKLYAYVYGGSVNSIGVMSCKADGTVTDSMLLPSQMTEEEKETLENSQQGGSVGVFEDMPVEDLAREKVIASEPAIEGGFISADDDNQNYEDPDESYNDSYNYSYVGYGDLTVGKDGTVYALRNYTHEYYEDDEYRSENKYYIESWDAKGNPLQSVEIEGLGYDEQAQTYRYVYGIVPNQDGSVQVILYGDKYETVTISKDGAVSGVKPMKLDSKYTDNMDRIMVNSDGKATILYWDMDWTKQYAAIYNLQTGAVEKENEIPYAVRKDGMNNCYPGSSTDVIFSNYNGVYTYNWGDAEATKIMDYVNSDLNCTGMNFLCSIDDDHFIGSYYDEGVWEEVFAFYTKVPADQLQAREVITIAGMYIQYNTDIKNRVIDFNKTNPKYRITITDYNQYNTDEDYTAGYTKLNNDIAAGKCPDIIVYDTGMAFESFEKKGLFVNMDDMIKQDPELSKLELMDNVLDAYRVDGKLYKLITSFTLNTVLAKKDLVGNKTSITMDEAIQTVKSMGADASMFGKEYTRGDYLYNLMAYCGTQFVDPVKGVCNFDSQEFKDHLTFMKSLPEEYDYNSLGEDYWSNYMAQYRNNKTLFYTANFSNASSLKYTINGVLGGNVAYVGFPSSTNGGAYISIADNCFAIAAKSEYVDGAWEFVRYYLTDDYQKKVEDDGNSYGRAMRWGNSVIKKYLKEDLKEAMERNVYVDEYDGTEWDNDVIWMGNEEVHYDPLTQAEVDELFNYMCTISNAYYTNQEINNIIAEEAAYFYNNQKSVDEVASVIQSRIQIYVNEQM